MWYIQCIMKKYDNFSRVFEIANQLLTRHSLHLAPRINGSLRSKRFRAVSEQRQREKWFHFSRGQNRESRSSVFLCSETARKRLLRRLNKWQRVFFLKRELSRLFLFSKMFI